MKPPSAGNTSRLTSIVIAAMCLLAGLASLSWVPPVRARIDVPRPAGTRRDAGYRAAKILLQTHLFSDGRGAIFPVPGIVPAFEFFRNPWMPVDVNGAFGRYLGANMQDRRAVGMFVATYNNAEVVAMGCVLCHSGRAAGRFIVGLGNKRIDVGSMGSLGAFVSQPFRLAALVSPDWRRAGWERSLDVAALLADRRWTNTTKGLVPDALIQRWFYRTAGRPIPPGLPAAEVKVPQMWGYGPKRNVGLFSDALGDGSAPGWGAMVELALGQTPEIVRSYTHRLEEIEALWERLLPPEYPFVVDQALAARGRSMFSIHCAGCHGEYRKDSEGLPVFEAPRFVPWHLVQTDPVRLECITPDFRRLVDTSPLNDLIRVQALPAGYLAPRLDGVWSRFPYLHNASVPTIRDLLTEPAARPTVWSLVDAGELDRFDAVRLGLKLTGPVTGMMRLSNSRDIYSTGRRGHSNQGHDFGTGLPESQKMELIEYLKTL